MKPGSHPSHGYRRWRPARQAGHLAGLRAGPSEQLPSPGWKRRPGAARGAGLGPAVTATGLSPLLHALTRAWKGPCLQPPQAWTVGPRTCLCQVPAGALWDAGSCFTPAVPSGL